MVVPSECNLEVRKLESTVSVLYRGTPQLEPASDIVARRVRNGVLSFIYRYIKTHDAENVL